MDQLSPTPLKRALGLLRLHHNVYNRPFSLGIFHFYAVSAAIFSGFLIFIFASIGLVLSEDIEFEPLPLITTIKNAKKVRSWMGHTVIAFILIFVVFKVVFLGGYSISVNVLREIFPDKPYIETYFPDASLLLYSFCFLLEILQQECFSGFLS